jgi:hypothetical protein
MDEPLIPGYLMDTLDGLVPVRDGGVVAYKK